MGWNERHGSVSRAFDEWRLIDGDQRAFLTLGLQIASESYERLWKEAGEEPYYDNGPEHVDVFEDRIEGLWEHDYRWMFLAAVLRDSVTNFEVYLEKAREEVLAHHGFQSESSPRWLQLRTFFAEIGVTIDPIDVRRVRELRHFLVHQRGELRTDKQRAKYALKSDDTIPHLMIELDEESVRDDMDTLGSTVRSIDSTVWSYTFGDKRSSGPWMDESSSPG